MEKYKDFVGKPVVVMTYSGVLNEDDTPKLDALFGILAAVDDGWLTLYRYMICKLDGPSSAIMIPFNEIQSVYLSAGVFFLPEAENKPEEKKKKRKRPKKVIRGVFRKARKKKE